MAKTGWLHLRVDPDLRARLETAAAADRRPVADWCRLALERALDVAEVKPADRPRVVKPPVEAEPPAEGAACPHGRPAGAVCQRCPRRVARAG